MGYIYKIINTINNKVYIGQTTRTIAERYEEHLNHARNSVNRHLYDAMNYYGIENFTVELLEDCEDAKLNGRESYWIKCYKSNDRAFGYNMTSGGEGGNTCASLSKERKQMRNAAIASKLAGRAQPRELVEKRAAKLRGQKRTEEQRQRFSEAQQKRDASTFARGFTVPQERRDKISQTLTGRVQSEKTKLKRKESISKLKWWNNGSENIRAVQCPEGFVAGRVNFKPSSESRSKSSHKGTKWFTNGTDNRMAYECPEGFWPGKTLKKDLIK